MAVSEELIKLAAGLVFQQMGKPYRAALERRIVGAAVSGALALIALLAAIGCAVGAFWLWLAPKLGPSQAALVSMAILLVIAAVLGLLAVSLARRSPSKALHDVMSSKDLAHLVNLVEGHVPQLMLAAAIGGLFFGLKRRK
jgi:uncharacterized membrane protein